jgi:hypothetical protein
MIYHLLLGELQQQHGNNQVSTPLAQSYLSTAQHTNVLPHTTPMLLIGHQRLRLLFGRECKLIITYQALSHPSLSGKRVGMSSSLSSRRIMCNTCKMTVLMRHRRVINRVTRVLDTMDSRRRLHLHRLGMVYHSKAKARRHIKAVIRTRRLGLMGSMEEDLGIER